MRNGPRTHAAVLGKKLWAGGRGIADSVDGAVPPERRVARAWKAQGIRSLGLLLYTFTGLSQPLKDSWSG